MPIYEYDCLDCRKPFEFLHLTSTSQAACPHCGGQQLERKISLFGSSSEDSRAASLSAAHQRAGQKRQDKQRAEHQQHHEHFEDTPSGDGHTH